MTTYSPVQDAPSALASVTRPRLGLRGALWAVQVVLAVAFAISGFMKLFVPIATLAEQAAWVVTVPAWIVRVIGLFEVAGAVGLVVPAGTRVEPKLTPLAATCLAAMMVFALVVHLSRGEFGAMAMPFLLGALASFVAWGRFMAAPIEPRETDPVVTA
jgi:hypothetical protein